MTEETRVTSSTGGQKGQKLARFDLIPPGPLKHLAEHYGRGAEKYDDRNWEKGYDWGLSFAALNRHLWAFWGGENYDEETGSHHLAAVLFHTMALLEFAVTHPEFDTRSKPETKLALREALAANGAAWKPYRDAIMDMRGM